MYKSHTKLLCRNKWQKWSHTVFVLQFPTPGRNRMVKLWQSTAIKEIQRNTNFDNFRSFHWPLTDTNDNFTSFIASLKKWKHKLEVAIYAMRWRIFRLKLWIQQRMKIWNKFWINFANVGSLCLDPHQKITVHCSPLNPKSAFILQSLNRNQVIFLCWSFRVLCCSPVSHWALRADFIPARSRHTYLHVFIYFFSSEILKPLLVFMRNALVWAEIPKFSCISLSVSVSLSLWDIPREGSSFLKHLKYMYNPLIHNLSFELQHPPQISPCPFTQHSNQPCCSLLLNHTCLLFSCSEIPARFLVALSMEVFKLFFYYALTAESLMEVLLCENRSLYPVPQQTLHWSEALLNTLCSVHSNRYGLINKFYILTSPRSSQWQSPGKYLAWCLGSSEMNGDLSLA